MTKATEATKIVRPQQVRKIKATPLSTFGLDLDRAVLGGLMAAERFPLEAVSLHAGNFSPDLYPLAKAVLSVGRRVGVCDPVAVAEELSRGGCGIDATVEVARLAEAVPSTVHLVPHIVRKCLTLPETPHAWRAVPKSCGFGTIE